MNLNLAHTWETYTASWAALTLEEKRSLFEQSLTQECEYSDPNTQRKGWDELSAYMLDFHTQIPNGSFVTRYFKAHNFQSIAKWDMLDHNGKILGDGISYGRYNEAGKLIAMTGFYETTHPQK